MVAFQVRQHGYVIGEAAIDESMTNNANIRGVHAIRVKILLLVVLVVLAVVGITSGTGCSAKDPTLTSAPPVTHSLDNPPQRASEQLLEKKRALAGQPPSGAPPKPAQPFIN